MPGLGWESSELAEPRTKASRGLVPAQCGGLDEAAVDSSQMSSCRAREKDSGQKWACDKGAGEGCIWGPVLGLSSSYKAESGTSAAAARGPVFVGGARGRNGPHAGARRGGRAGLRGFGVLRNGLHWPPLGRTS